MLQRLAPAIACAAVLLAGCGQKGPLYLPDKNGTVVSSSPASAPPTGPAPVQPTPKKDDSEDDSPPPQ
jgi:predicted small lipoprotein YifL